MCSYLIHGYNTKFELLTVLAVFLKEKTYPLLAFKFQFWFFLLKNQLLKFKAFSREGLTLGFVSVGRASKCQSPLLMPQSIEMVAVFLFLDFSMARNEFANGECECRSLMEESEYHSLAESTIHNLQEKLEVSLALIHVLH